MPKPSYVLTFYKDVPFQRDGQDVPMFKTATKRRQWLATYQVDTHNTDSDWYPNRTSFQWEVTSLNDEIFYCNYLRVEEYNGNDLSWYYWIDKIEALPKDHASQIGRFVRVEISLDPWQTYFFYNDGHANLNVAQIVNAKVSQTTNPYFCSEYDPVPVQPQSIGAISFTDTLLDYKTYRLVAYYAVNNEETAQVLVSSSLLSFDDTGTPSYREILYKQYGELSTAKYIRRKNGGTLEAEKLINCLAVYLVPSDLVPTAGSFIVSDYYFYVSDDHISSETGHTAFATIKAGDGISRSLTITGAHFDTFIYEVGTLFNRFRLPETLGNVFQIFAISKFGEKDLKIFLSCCGSIKDITNDFALPIVTSPSAEYLAQNETSLAVNTATTAISSFASFAASAYTGNVGGSISSMTSFIQGTIGTAARLEDIKLQPVKIEGSGDGFTNCHSVLGGLGYCTYAKSNSSNVKDTKKYFGAQVNRFATSIDVTDTTEDFEFYQLDTATFVGFFGEDYANYFRTRFAMGVRLWNLERL